MLRVSEQYAVTDTGRQRRANEDSLLTRSPLFVVADGMGGAQAGEVASRIAVESFQAGLPDDSEPELQLSALAQAANSRIHELSHANAEQAGMGTTLTAVYVGEEEVAIAHVGDSRAYCLRDGGLDRKSTRLNSSHADIYPFSLHDALPISGRDGHDADRRLRGRGGGRDRARRRQPRLLSARRRPRSEEHTSELQSRRYLPFFPPRRSSDLRPGWARR